VYVRVFSSLLDSSLNQNSFPVEARWLFLVMLMIADEDRTGVVDMPVGRLAARAGMTLQQTKKALKLLSSPDHESRSDEQDGRRIIPMEEGKERGWCLVNWQKYKDIARAERRRENVRKAVAAHRERQRNTDVIQANMSESPPSDSEAASGNGESPRGERKGRMGRPTLEEVEAHIALRGYQIDALKFYAHYESNGWMVGKNAMRSWKAALVTWSRGNG
jgi:hypothetical protein